MWFVTKSIFDYIVNTNLSKNKKADIIRDNQRKIRKEIKHLTPKEIVQYLFNSKIPNELKRMITEEVNELSTKNDDISKNKIDRLIIEFKKIKYNKEKFIKSGLCPDIFKKVVIDKVYGKDLVKAVTDNSINREIRKEIIRLNIRESEDVVKLLSKELPKDFEDYILENCFNDEYDIRRVLDSVKVSDRVKERIVREKVNISNMFKILYLAFVNTEKLIYKIKAEEIKRYSDSLNYKNILGVINNYNTPRSFVEYLIEHKEEEICKAIDRAKLDVIATTVFKERDSKIIKIVLERKNKTLYKVINNLYDFQLLNWLNIKNLPIEYKTYIITKHKRKLKMAINRLSAYDAKNYLKVESVVPQEIQDLILESCKDKIFEDAIKNGDADLISTIRYQSLSLPVRRLLIKEKINKNNVFLLLGEKYLDNETLMLTLELKKDVIRECLKKYEAEELFKLKIKGISKENAGKILEDNQDLVRDKVNSIDKSELMEYFDDDNVHKIVKKIILEECFVNEDDVDNILSLIECYDTRLILDNYDYIKKFIINLGINFGAFLQYGSGSRKYSNWLDRIIEIMFEDMMDDFIRCKEYLFKNYYEIDDENSISAISCFLEYLDNFRRYKALFISMVDNGVVLSEDDKVNISFLFNIKKSKRMVYPTRIEDLANFKLKLYKEYVDCIKDEYASLEELQKIFNDVLFCEAKNILEYIGGTGALRTLKKDNINSPSVVLLVDELMVYSTMIELVNDTNNVEGLRNVLSYIFSDNNILMKLQKIFSNFERKVTRLYELDSNNNLTRISDAREIEGCLDIEKCLEYGGEVFNFSDKNYCLYGHILSRKEKIEDVINGVATGDSNFISVSPISYRGQKYYWDRDNVIVVYDYVPSGKFICSSISNMGTNYIVRNNSSEVGNINRMQRGILETSAVVKQNAEALLYREGLKVCGLVLPGNRKPSKEEMEIHEKYGLPFIITQNVKEAIDNPKFVFINDLEVETKIGDIKEVEEILKMLRPNVSIKKEDAIYTGKEIAIFADWGNQRVKGISILEVIRDVLRKILNIKNSKNTETSLIETFVYPKLGTIQMWNEMAKKIKDMGGKIYLNSNVNNIVLKNNKITEIGYTVDNKNKKIKCDILISSMPISELIKAFKGNKISKKIYNAAVSLPYREFMSVALLVDKLELKNNTKFKTINDVIPDSWIYIQDENVKMGRVQVFNNWSPYLFNNKNDIKDKVLLSLEYFTSVDDKYWNMSDEEFIDFAISEAEKINLFIKENVISSTRIKIPKAYPAYFDSYEYMDDIIKYLNQFDNLYCIGRNGQHRYNNMDHSMMTGVEVVENIINNKSSKDNIWMVNTEQEYHEKIINK